MADCAAISASLISLRHTLAWEGHEHPGAFHASSDPAPVRERVYEAISGHDFRVDSLIIEKSKAQPSIRPTDERFYQYAWFYLMRFLARKLAKGDQLLVVAASVGTKKKRRAFYAGVRDVMNQVALGIECKTACWDAAADPCLQVADYCGWAIQRKWENGDASAHEKIERKIKSEYNIFRVGTTHYY